MFSDCPRFCQKNVLQRELVARKGFCLKEASPFEIGPRVGTVEGISLELLYEHILQDLHLSSHHR